MLRSPMCAARLEVLTAHGLGAAMSEVLNICKKDDPAIDSKRFVPQELTQLAVFSNSCATSRDDEASHRAGRWCVRAEVPTVLQIGTESSVMSITRTFWSIQQAGPEFRGRSVRDRTRRIPYIAIRDSPPRLDVANEYISWRIHKYISWRIHKKYNTVVQ